MDNGGKGSFAGRGVGWSGLSALDVIVADYMGRWPRMVWGRAVGAGDGLGLTMVGQDGERGFDSTLTALGFSGGGVTRVALGGQPGSE
jgi:hypothetical protein